MKRQSDYGLETALCGLGFSLARTLLQSTVSRFTNAFSGTKSSAATTRPSPTAGHNGLGKSFVPSRSESYRQPRTVRVSMTSCWSAKIRTHRNGCSLPRPQSFGRCPPLFLAPSRWQGTRRHSEGALWRIESSAAVLVFSSWPLSFRVANRATRLGAPEKPALLCRLPGSSFTASYCFSAGPQPWPPGPASPLGHPVCRAQRSNYSRCCCTDSGKPSALRHWQKNSSRPSAPS
jgi:hypothetical protein